MSSDMQKLILPISGLLVIFGVVMAPFLGLGRVMLAVGVRGLRVVLAFGAVRSRRSDSQR